MSFLRLTTRELQGLELEIDQPTVPRTKSTRRCFEHPWPPENTAKNAFRESAFACGRHEHIGIDKA